jgi:preprotein translocase subunit SecA
MRKHVLEYDDVINQHRLIVYGKRQRLLEDFAKNETTQSDISLVMKKIFAEETERMIMQHDEDGHTDFEKLSHSLSEMLDKSIILKESDFDTTREAIISLWEEKQSELKKLFEDRNFDQFQREIYLASIDQLWMEHIENMSQLREDVAFEGYNQKQPLLVYQERGYEMFVKMMDEINYRVVRGLLSATPRTQVQQVEIDLDELKTISALSPEKTPSSQNNHPLMRQSGEE